jgi:RimJ/RimL family protein N-acetyltransferase
MLDPSLRRSGWAIESMALFVDYVFRMWNFHRLYAVALDATFDDVHAGEGRFFLREGCMREHEWVDGRYADLHFLTIPRDLWQRHGSPLAGRLTATSRKEGT